MNAKAVRDQIIPLADYILIWVDSFLTSKESENVSPHSLRFYRNNLRVFCDFCETQSLRQISELSPVFLREFLMVLRESGHNAGGVHGFYRSLRAFLNWYWEETEPEFPNPIRRVKGPKVPIEPQQGVTLDEFEELLRVCRNERDRAILLVLMDTGVRAEELTSIKLADVDFDRILIAQGKGRKPRTVFMGRRTRKQVRRYLQHHIGTYLFTNEDGDKLVYPALRQILRRLGLRAGIKGISPHDFRRGYTLEALRKGVDLLTLSRLLGHSSLALLSRYAKQTAIDLNRYSSILDD